MLPCSPRLSVDELNRAKVWSSFFFHSTGSRPYVTIVTPPRPCVVRLFIFLLLHGLFWQPLDFFLAVDSIRQCLLFSCWLQKQINFIAIKSARAKDGNGYNERYSVEHCMINPFSAVSNNGVVTCIRRIARYLRRFRSHYFFVTGAREIARDVIESDNNRLMNRTNWHTNSVELPTPVTAMFRHCPFIEMPEWV